MKKMKKAGILDEPISQAEIIAVSARVHAQFADLITAIVSEI